MGVEGATDRWVFEASKSSTPLHPSCGPRTGGDHGQPPRSQAQEGEGADRGEGLRALVYLPAYSPDLNPIEEAFSKIKDMLRRAGARTKEALVEVLVEALSAVSSRDARGYFEHAGYRPQVQLL
jgi:hypothetical protein